MSKGVKKVTNWGKDVVKGATKTIVSPFKGAGHLVQAGVHLLEGDLSAAGKSFSKSVGDFTQFTVGSTGIGIVAPKLTETAKNLASAATSYGTLNFNQGSEYLEKATGYDIDNSKAEAAERAAQAEYDRQAQEAADAAARNRRANLLSLRKTLTPSLSRSTQGGGGAGATELNAGSGGIILGR